MIADTRVIRVLPLGIDIDLYRLLTLSYQVAHVQRRDVGALCFEHSACINDSIICLTVCWGKLGIAGGFRNDWLSVSKSSGHKIIKSLEL